MGDQYTCVGCCDTTRQVDQLRKRYKQEREELGMLLMNNPRSIPTRLWTIFSCDETCRWDSRHARCAQCRNLQRIGLQNPTEPFTLHCGKARGLVLKLTTEEDVHLQLKLKSYPEKLRRRLKSEPRHYLAVDPFTNNLLQNIILERIFSAEHLEHHLPKLETAYFCGGNGYTVTEYVRETTPNIKELFRQLTVLFTVLEPYDFTFGLAGPRALLWTNEPCSYRYKNIVVQSSGTLKLQGLQHSSLSLSTKEGLTRIYARTKLGSCYLEASSHLPIHYLIGPENLTEFYQLHLAGVPYNSPSFDLYLFVVGLAWDPRYRREVCAQSWWKDLWSSEDEVILLSRMEHLPLSSDPLVIAQLLVNLKLRPDVLGCLQKAYA